MVTNAKPTGNSKPEVTYESLKGISVFGPKNKQATEQKNSPSGPAGVTTEKK